MSVDAGLAVVVDADAGAVSRLMEGLVLQADAQQTGVLVLAG